MLDIVITHYTEPYEVGEKMFRMIGLQRCVDFEQIRVMVVNDGGHRLPEEKLSELPYPVEQVDIPHGGISAARNAGIDHATGRWIMFCDFDDCFASAYSLREIMAQLGSDDYDMLWCRLMAEDYIGGMELLYYVPDKQRYVFCHGKVYRTAFLREKNIRFDTSLVFNEDSCFNAIIIARTPHTRIGEIKTYMPIYAWIRRESSVTNSGRTDEAGYGHFRRNFIVTEEYERNNDDRKYGMVTRTAYDVYYMIHGKRHGTNMKRRMLTEFAEWIHDRIDGFGRVSSDVLNEIQNVAKSELIEPDEHVQDSHEQVRQWVEQVARQWENSTT